MGSAKPHILLTGPPGIGKTTLMQKVCKLLRDTGFSTRGFLTEEIRNGRMRIGFDVVTLNGERGPLARLPQAGAGAALRYAVGRYTVSLKSFETLALPVFPAQPNFEGILVLDEIGRMELLSDRFKEEVTKAFNNPSITILATIPVMHMAFTESLRKSPNSIVLVVSSYDKLMNSNIKSSGSVMSDVTSILGTLVILYTKLPALETFNVKHKSLDESDKRDRHYCCQPILYISHIWFIFQCYKKIIMSCTTCEISQI